MLGALVATALAAVVGSASARWCATRRSRSPSPLVWMSIVEALLVGFVPEVGRWLPGGAASALGGTVTAEGGLLPIWGAALLLAGYGLAFAAAGTRLVLRRDIA